MLRRDSTGLPPPLGERIRLWLRERIVRTSRVGRVVNRRRPSSQTRQLTRQEHSLDHGNQTTSIGPETLVVDGQRVTAG